MGLLRWYLGAICTNCISVYVYGDNKVSKRSEYKEMECVAALHAQDDK